MKVLNILLVDDMEDSRMILKNILESAGYSVTTAINGRDGMDKARSSIPDLIVSDILMPEMDGFEFCRGIKKDDRLRKIPFIFYTATFTDQEDKNLALALGATRFIAKPVDNRIFLLTIREVLSEHEQYVPQGTSKPLKEEELLRVYESRLLDKLYENNQALEKEHLAILQKTAELRASEEKYRTIFDSVNDGIFILDIADAGILDINQKMCDLFGYSREEALQLKLEDLSASDAAITRKAAQTYIHKAVKEGPQCFQWQCKDKGERLFWVEVSLKRINIEGTDRIIAVLRDMAEQKRAEQILRDSEERFRTIFENSPVGISIANANGEIIDSNPAFQNMLGYTEEELSRKSSEITFPDDIPQNMLLYQEMLDGIRDHYMMEKRYYHKDGSIVWANLIVTAIRDSNRDFKYNFAIIENITERKKLEDQLRHAQKLEAVGQLAGGISHDFNNILTAIIGYGSLLKLKLKGDEQLTHNINQILAITERGAGLTQSLLAFSRKQRIFLAPINPNDLIKRISQLIPRLLGEEIEFKMKLCDQNMMIMADSSQLEQVLMNLAGNARDAMPGGGVLTIETDQVILERDYAKRHGFGAPGLYACISVSDTGTGIDIETMDKIFEPFFTTKEVGEGTGLGLSLVYGIIKQHNGYINVYSEPGHGTTFKIHLPLIEDVNTERPMVEEDDMFGGSETILLAEDETEVRGAIKEILQEYGFAVIEAVDGKDAIEKYSDNKDKIHLILMDVVMPKMNGKDAIDEIRKITPGIKTIFTSGYTAKTVEARGVFEEGVHFLSKPVMPRNLLKKIREVLDES